MKKAKASDTRESKATKTFAVGLPGSNPPAQKVKPAWPIAIEHTTQFQ